MANVQPTFKKIQGSLKKIQKQTWSNQAAMSIFQGKNNLINKYFNSKIIF